MSNDFFPKIQKILDDFWSATIFKIIPLWFKPNYFSLIRLGLIPVIYLCLIKNSFLLAVIIFIIAAFLDTLDGALARIRQQTSAWGLFLDPLADKLLVVIVLFFLLFVYPLPFLLASIILIEIIASLIGLIFLSKTTLPSASYFGKFKMFTQSTGVVLALLWLNLKFDLLLSLSTVLFLTSFILQICNLIYFLRRGPFSTQ